MAPEAHPDPTQASRIHERVHAQFGAAAAAYSTSLVHADPAALARIVELAAPKSTDVALDIATGSGNTAMALAPHVAQVIAGCGGNREMARGKLQHDYGNSYLLYYLFHS